jgi:hypothetical protein
MYHPEIRNRIRLSVAAYAYEVCADPIMSDAEFDALAASIVPAVATNRPDLDQFFAETFDPSTGAWVHQHPDLPGIRRLYDSVYACARR